MGWTPAEVRRTSLSDFAAALDGFARSKGVEEGATDPLTRAELDDLLRRYKKGKFAT